MSKITAAKKSASSPLFLDDFLKSTFPIQFDIEFLGKIANVMSQLSRNVKENAPTIKKIKAKLEQTTPSNSNIDIRIRFLDILSMPFVKDPEGFKEFIQLKDALLIASMQYVTDNPKKIHEFKIDSIKKAWNNKLDKASVKSFAKALDAVFAILQINKEDLKKEYPNLKDGFLKFFCFLFSYLISKERFDLCNHLLLNHKEHIISAVDNWGHASKQLGEAIDLVSLFKYTKSNIQEDRYLFVSSLEIALICVIKSSGTPTEKQKIFKAIENIISDVKDPISKIILDNFCAMTRVRLEGDFNISLGLPPKVPSPTTTYLKPKSNTDATFYKITSEGIEKALTDMRSEKGFYSCNWLISLICTEFALRDCEFITKEFESNIVELITPFFIKDLQINSSDSSKFAFAIYSIPNFFLSLPELQKHILLSLENKNEEFKTLLVECLKFKKTSSHAEILQKFINTIEFCHHLFCMQRNWVDTKITPDINLLTNTYKIIPFDNLILFGNLSFVFELFMCGIGKEDEKSYLHYLFVLLSLMKDESISISHEQNKKLSIFLESFSIQHMEKLKEIQAMINSRMNSSNLELLD